VFFRAAAFGDGDGGQRQPGRGLDLLEAQVGHQPLAAAGGQAGQHGLEFGDVAGDDGEDVVHLAGHVVGRDDLRRRADQVVEHAAGPRVVPGPRGRHVHLEREARQGGVQLGTDHPDDAGFLQPPDAVQRGGRGQPGQPRQFHVGAVRVLLERG
jgi:hypothetical protein